MPRLPKPKPPTFNGHTFSPSERRAILTAATKGYVFRAGKLGNGPEKEDKRSHEHRLTYISLGVLAKLHSKGVMTNGSGYAQHKLTNDFRSHCLPDMEYFFTQEAEWLEDRANRKAAADERKALKALKAQQKAEKDAAK